mmetsp:Transcript_104151/g.335857  ORF Transcript_104151/g.335857 Transcript_104151/m.335857 type:complete len:325 (+) Transcript_104151:874-1848(+)
MPAVVPHTHAEAVHILARHANTQTGVARNPAPAHTLVAASARRAVVPVPDAEGLVAPRPEAPPWQGRGDPPAAPVAAVATAWGAHDQVALVQTPGRGALRWAAALLRAEAPAPALQPHRQARSAAGRAGVELLHLALQPGERAGAPARVAGAAPTTSSDSACHASVPVQPWLLQHAGQPGRPAGCSRRELPTRSALAPLLVMFQVGPQALVARLAAAWVRVRLVSVAVEAAEPRWPLLQGCPPALGRARVEGLQWGPACLQQWLPPRAAAQQRPRVAAVQRPRAAALQRPQVAALQPQRAAALQVSLLLAPRRPTHQESSGVRF